MFRAIVAATSLSMLAACNTAPRPGLVLVSETVIISTQKRNMLELTRSDREVVQRMVASRLKDPGAAIVTDMIAFTLGNGTDVSICGTVDGKDTFGRYVGARPFYVHGRYEHGRIKVGPAVSLFGIEKCL